MIVNNLKALTRKQPPGPEEEGGIQTKPVTSIVLKINIDKRASSFEESLLLLFLKNFKLNFQLDTSRVPTFRGCRPHSERRAPPSGGEWTIHL